jgi:hypothetical protein
MEVDRRIVSGSRGETQTVTVRERYDSRHQRVDVLGPDGRVHHRLSLFDAEKGEAYLFDDVGKKFLVTRRVALEEATGAKARRPAKSSRESFARAGSKQVGAWTCTVYRVTRGSETLGETCTVPFRTLALTTKDLGSYGQVGQLDGPGLARDTAWMYDTRHGFPVEVVAAERRGFPSTRVQVLAVRKVAFPPDTFSVPSGYTRSETPPLPGEVSVPSRASTPALPR